MNLKLDPPSGFADSYFDIEFLASFNKAPKSVVTLHNDTSEEHLDIIGVTLGYIINGKSAVVKNASQLRGHFNLFNDDKMNKKFALYSSAKVRCRVEHFDEEDNSIGNEEEILVFYNESHSLDSEVIPFDIVIHNSHVDLKDHESLKIDIISGLPKNYIIGIKSADEKSQCTLEISALQGKTSVEVPLAMLAYDLDLKTHGRKKFNIYYVKHQGTTLSRIANRKYYKIDNTELTFDFTNGIGLKPQSRIDPCGREFTKNFVLSDRYLVLCPREFSGFAKKGEFGPEKLMDLTMLVHEGQHMESLAKEMRQFSAEDDSLGKVAATQKAVQHGKHAGAKKIRPRISSDQIQLMRSVSGAYESIISRPKGTGQPVQSNPQKVSTFSTGSQRQSSKKPCSPCLRKRNKNA